MTWWKMRLSKFIGTEAEAIGEATKKEVYEGEYHIIR